MHTTFVPVVMCVVGILPTYIYTTNSRLKRVPAAKRSSTPLANNNPNITGFFFFGSFFFFFINLAKKPFFIYMYTRGYIRFVWTLEYFFFFFLYFSLFFRNALTHFCGISLRFPLEKKKKPPEEKKEHGSSKGNTHATAYYTLHNSIYTDADITADFCKNNKKALQTNEEIREFHRNYNNIGRFGIKYNLKRK